LIEIADKLEKQQLSFMLLNMKHCVEKENVYEVKYIAAKSLDLFKDLVHVEELALIINEIQHILGKDLGKQ
jgi:hypothetical protein